MLSVDEMIEAVVNGSDAYDVINEKVDNEFFLSTGYSAENKFSSLLKKAGIKYKLTTPHKGVTKVEVDPKDAKQATELFNKSVKKKAKPRPTFTY